MSISRLGTLLLGIVLVALLLGCNALALGPKCYEGTVRATHPGGYPVLRVPGRE